ncbi:MULTISPECIES: hypothetical protein [unclassified Dietzia]|uniref:hypothetical protein n=1 Tax=unclassified Dietzia TaxID=2617939 RepID=UPI0015FC3755|nr:MULTISPECIES: hypothetical protein [unclassified Dietzia]MBB1041517.1 hypothetical protein [Dietzia sp. Cai40]MBB1045791.1 hypothetical protein [Dietzia sp. DQ11-44]
MSVEPISDEPPSRSELAGKADDPPRGSELRAGSSEEPPRGSELKAGRSDDSPAELGNSEEPGNDAEPSSGLKPDDPPARSPAEPVNGSRRSPIIPKSGRALWALAVPVAPEMASAAVAATAAAFVDLFTEEVLSMVVVLSVPRLTGARRTGCFT